jgi:rhamnosyltransferase
MLVSSEDFVIAVIASFNGFTTILDTISAIRNQVDYIYVVDNGSKSDSLDLLKHLSAQGIIELIDLKENKGIALALNLGVERAKQLGSKWVLTMDQDSLPETDMVSVMLKYQKFNKNAKCLSPNLINNKTECSIKKDTISSYAITSGNLVHIDIFNKVGCYNVGYFIDCVDFEFSLRVRKAGFEIHKVKDAKMYHTVGQSSYIPSLIKSFYTRHPPIRRYYMFRNYFLLARKYLFFDFLFIVKLGLLQIILLIIILIYEENRTDTFWHVWMGVIDGVLKKDGRFIRANT